MCCAEPGGHPEPIPARQPRGAHTRYLLPYLHMPLPMASESCHHSAMAQPGQVSFNVFASCWGSSLHTYMLQAWCACAKMFRVLGWRWGVSMHGAGTMRVLRWMRKLPQKLVSGVIMTQPVLAAGVLRSLRGRTGFSATEVFRKYLWYALRERKFDEDAVVDLALLRNALSMSDAEARATGACLHFKNALDILRFIRQCSEPGGVSGPRALGTGTSMQGVQSKDSLSVWRCTVTAQTPSRARYQEKHSMC